MKVLIEAININYQDETCQGDNEKQYIVENALVKYKILIGANDHLHGTFQVKGDFDNLTIAEIKKIIDKDTKQKLGYLVNELNIA